MTDDWFPLAAVAAVAADSDPVETCCEVEERQGTRLEMELR